MRRETRVEHTEAQRAASSIPNQTPAQPLPPGAIPQDTAITAQLKASNQAAIAQLSNQVGAGVQEWQTPVRPLDTPNMRQAAQSERAIQQGQSLQSSGPADTPRWAQTSPHSPAQQTQQAGQSLQAAGVTHANAPQSAETRAQMQTALDRSAHMEQNSGGGSRLEAARQQAIDSSAPAVSTEKQR